MYYCDYCFINDVNNYNIVKKYFKCPLKSDFKRHLQTKKCIKNRANVENLENENKITCEHCNRTFNRDGYNNHIKINKQLHDILNGNNYNHLITQWKLEEWVEEQIDLKNIKCNHYVLEYKNTITRCTDLNDLITKYCKKKNPNWKAHPNPI